MPLAAPAATAITPNAAPAAAGGSITQPLVMANINAHMASGYAPVKSSRSSGAAMSPHPGIPTGSKPMLPTSSRA